MKRILVLLVFGLSLVIPLFGSKDFLNTLTTVAAHEYCKTAKDMGHVSVLLLEQIVRRLRL
jgi:diacylglycerol kinase